MLVLDFVGFLVCFCYIVLFIMSYINIEVVYLWRYFNVIFERWCMRVWGVDVVDLMVFMIVFVNIIIDLLFLFLCGLVVVFWFGDDFFVLIV